MLGPGVENDKSRRATPGRTTLPSFLFSLHSHTQTLLVVVIFKAHSCSIDFVVGPLYIFGMSGDVALVVVSIVLVILASLVVAARCVARFVIVREKAIADGLIIAALCCSIALTGLFIAGMMVLTR